MVLYHLRNSNETQKIYFPIKTVVVSGNETLLVKKLYSLVVVTQEGDDFAYFCRLGNQWDPIWCIVPTRVTAFFGPDQAKRGPQVVKRLNPRDALHLPFGQILVTGVGGCNK